MNEKIILFDTSIASFNKGDEIIMRSIRSVLKNWLTTLDVYYLPTHIPCFTEWQDRHPNFRVNFFKEVPLKLLCGTDIIAKYRPYYFGQWDMNFNNASVAKGIVCLAVGYSGEHISNKNPLKAYISKRNTQDFYRTILNHELIHSSRDEETAAYLRSIEVRQGVNLKAVNTGCVTTWMLSPAFCHSINPKKRENVLFTINCRTRQPEQDAALIDLLRDEYKTLYFWPQQWEDIDYFGELKTRFHKDNWNVHVLPMSVDKLQEVFINANVDYIGLRLHCGIFAMQNRCRAFILQADHRSKDISSAQNLNLFDRNDMATIKTAIQDVVETKIHVNYEKINVFLNQFGIELVVEGQKVFARSL